MALKSKTMEIVWSKDLDDFIEECLGREWSCGQNDDRAYMDALTLYEVQKDPRATATVQAWLDSPPAGCPGRLNQPGFAESVEIYTCEILSELCNRAIARRRDKCPSLVVTKMARIVIMFDTGETYSSFRIRSQPAWGEQLENKLPTIIHDLQEVLEIEHNNDDV